MLYFQSLAASPNLLSQDLPTSTYCLESYLLQRFWREGWICNKTLQKLGGTNPAIGISSDLFSAKL
jgi:hypothetical protein